MFVNVSCSSSSQPQMITWLWFLGIRRCFCLWIWLYIYYIPISPKNPGVLLRSHCTMPASPPAVRQCRSQKTCLGPCIPVTCSGACSQDPSTFSWCLPLVQPLHPKWKCRTWEMFVFLVEIHEIQQCKLQTQIKNLQTLVGNNPSCPHHNSSPYIQSRGWQWCFIFSIPLRIHQGRYIYVL